MTDSAIVAITAAITSIVTIALTKGVDAIIRYRQSEGAMEMSSENNLRARIIHLENEVSRLQNEVATLQYRLGKSDAHIELLQGRCDKADLPQPDHKQPPT